MALQTTQPDQDRVALAAAERLGRTLAERVQWPLPSGIEIWAYPNLEAFRNITGEPGWVAAHTEGRRIHIQPVALLRSRDALDPTLSHELLHVLVESQAEKGLPVWFREGLVGFLEGRRTTANARVPAEAELRQTADAATTRRAYASAAAMVSNLVETYGEATVLSWVRGGLPPEVTKARTSQEPAKSK